VANSAKKLDVVLQTSSDVQESQAFKTLRDDLTARLEVIRVEISRDYILKAAILTVMAKRRQYHAAFCTYIHQIALMFIAQHDTKNYNGHQAIMDILIQKVDDILVPMKMTPREFLTLYKEVNNVEKLPYPTVEFHDDERRLINSVNGIDTTTPTTPGTPSNNIPTTNITTPPAAITPAAVETPIDHLDGVPDGEFDTDDMVDDDEIVDGNDDTALVGGRLHITRLTYGAIIRTVYHPMDDFYDQLVINEEKKRIKSVLTPIRMDDAATRIASVLGKEAPPPTKPVLRGLIEETAERTIATTERRLKSAEDRLTAISSKKVRGDGMKPKSILRSGTPIAAKSNAPKKTTTPKKTTSPKNASKAKSKSKKSPNGRDVNNNDTASGKKVGNRKVSFEKKKKTSRTNSHK